MKRSYLTRLNHLPRHYHKLLLLSLMVAVILLYIAWEKSGSEVKLAAFQRAYAERAYNLSFSSSDTILIIAPHCDDEVLGAGGLIYDARSQGARVYVVVVTNGDASRILWSRTKKAVELGYRRQKESLAALEVLGVSREKIFFLGYPDQGLALLWTEHWSSANPYFSRFTRNWMDSYFTSYRPGSIYSGTNLILELSSIISRIQPTIIITASPFDRHPDHWASYVFTMYALEKLRIKGALSHEPRVYWYLVHYGVWPYASGFRPRGLLLPPPGLCLPHIDWQLYFPSSYAAFAKARAIRKYQSQSPLGEHLLSFVRKNELFGKNLTVTIPMVFAPLDIDGRVEEWPEIVSHYQEPSREKIWAREHQILSFKVARDATSLYITLFLDKPASLRDTYALHLYPVTAFNEDQDFAHSLHLSLQKNGSETLSSHPAVQAAIKGKRIEVAIPFELLHHAQSFFFHAEVQRHKKTIGKTSWYFLRLGE